MYFFVKVRIDVKQLAELGQKLQSGELDTSSLKMTYCLADDISVGLNIWEAENRADFEQKFAPHKKYYQDIFEVTPVITPADSMQQLMQL